MYRTVCTVVVGGRGLAAPSYPNLVAIQYKLGTATQCYNVGETVKIKYYPSKPNDCMESKNSKLVILIILAIGLTVIAVLLAVSSLTGS